MWGQWDARIALNHWSGGATARRHRHRPSVDQWTKVAIIAFPIFEALSLSFSFTVSPYAVIATVEPTGVNSSETDKLWPALRERCLLLLHSLEPCFPLPSLHRRPLRTAAHSAAHFSLSFSCGDQWRQKTVSKSLLCPPGRHRSLVHTFPSDASTTQLTSLAKGDKVILACCTWLNSTLE